MFDGDMTREECLEKIEEILIWAESDDNFDDSFIESLKGQIMDRKNLSRKQQESLGRVWNKFANKNIDIREP